MSDLHIALLIVAAVLLAALWLYSKWQERRALKRMEASLRHGVTDALMAQVEPMGAAPLAAADAAAPVEATLPPQPAPEPPVPAAFSETIPLHPSIAGRIEPRFNLPAEEASTTPPRAPAGPEVRTAAHLAAGGWIEDPLLDCVLELRCAHAVDGVAVLDAAGALARAALPLPVHLAAWDARHQQWTHPDRFGFYAELLVATQLATRRHALDDIEASRFVAAVQQIAVTLDADFDPPDVARIVAMAKEVESTAAQFDVQIGLTLESTTGPWEAARLHDAATRAGLVASEREARLRWRRVGAEGATLFSLTSASLLSDRLVLELDVPLAPATAQPLRVMADTANVLAAALGARVVDDIGRPIEAASLAAIEEQLHALYADMRVAGIEPGSLRALRLYG
ncbi:MAG TPA: hypothetical protein VFR86_09485 [Burkholderiaceae bacterium]|nr:hypothetical protein [Burkholderiaceae bacterium]